MFEPTQIVTVTYGDWMFVNAIALFMLFISAIGFFMSIFNQD